AWLATAAEALTQIATAIPALPLAISADGRSIDYYLSICSLTRTGAMIREGLIFVDHSPQQDFTAAQRATTATTGAAPAPISLSPAPSAVESDSADSAPAPSVRTREEDDLARSAAERFLFDRLQEYSETTGLFALNEIIAAEGVHGQKAEIDLCSPSLRIAIEIDGYYHFGEPEAYRRDRRKDWALQQAGYVILRFLADDVVDQLETVLERIAATVRRQRAQKPTQGESCR
ncbi:MAG TPA: DUF559 domain-containing protein, partial [Planctomycetaceae bacterium]|nr:DUF559 domain-containing protein [Planctomycetaceae bacterium]